MLLCFMVTASIIARLLGTPNSKLRGASLCWASSWVATWPPSFMPSADLQIAATDASPANECIPRGAAQTSHQWSSAGEWPEIRADWGRLGAGSQWQWHVLYLKDSSWLTYAACSISDLCQQKSWNIDLRCPIGRRGFLGDNKIKTHNTTFCASNFGKY